ncbi:gliding motility-associated ABC transporter permease subunit GldF [Flavobacterium agricola]|uniref:Gliding motility-associated ABC transporter permease subunit GldF n=1 Tax=Flavobacterium agricola TaxID=2870839 RepID=A0ABY6LZX2_9FLAO|nr:gliding motility-associated ABC transporter permease subunit GldF [Flavobacterium agricola]UYW01122.1 gliding motility-associated ABC transporter permease subunit GldF [Flavobacterium agricola]
MKALMLREIKAFFGSPIGYLVLLIFLLINGLFLWVFEGEYNILNGGFADLSPFFTLAPWVLLFLIPATTMKSFSDELKLGTIELLFTKPLSLTQIVMGKFLGAFVLILIAIIPTLIYVWVIQDYTYLDNYMDMGSTLGSYFGLCFLIAAYTAVGVFTSTLSENQIVAFILAVVLCFILFYGLDAVANLMGSFGQTLRYFSLQNHYSSISRGVIDSRDIIYFTSVTVFFIAATVYKLKTLKA